MRSFGSMVSFRILIKQSYLIEEFISLAFYGRRLSKLSADFQIRMNDAVRKNYKKPWYRIDDTEANNTRARYAYEAMMTVTSRMPETVEYEEFSEKVKTIAKNKYDFDYGDESVNIFVTAFYEAVILYAMALNETLAQGYNITSGSVITSKMWNRTYTGITGNVSINENGDRYVDYSLLDMNPETGIFEAVANYYGVTKQFIDVPGKRIHWAGGRLTAPPDTPPCGFDNSKCPDDDSFLHNQAKYYLFDFVPIVSRNLEAITFRFSQGDEDERAPLTILVALRTTL
ncbi:Receptor-type guanylate cyclase gcy-28 [Nymphon striatum]|nr:Receptor-type guanylate cyclase gcy-28 [Nymphon striatum]